MHLINLEMSVKLYLNISKSFECGKDVPIATIVVHLKAIMIFNDM